MSTPPRADPPRTSWTPDLVRKRLQGLSLRAPVVEPTHAAYRDAAAVLAWFDPTTLQPLGGSAALAPVLSALLADCVQVRDDAGDLRWSLRPEIRAQVLRGLVARGDISAALAANPVRPTGPLQSTLEGCLLGNALPIERQKRAYLLASLQITEWLEGMVSGLPDRERLRERLEIDDLLSPLQRLAGEHFQGRTAELARLREYAGVLDEAPRDILSLEEKPPLVIHAIGGQGKSTLLARFILERVEGGVSKHLSFAYLDFDHPSLRADEPLTLLVEILRQIGVQYPSQRAACDAARQEIGRGLSQRQGTSSGAWEQSLDIGALVGILREAGAEYRSFLLVLDTFEEVQYSSRSYIGELWRFLDGLQHAIPRLRTVLAGRSPVEDFKSEALLLGDLDTAAGVAFLQSQGVESLAMARTVVEQLGGNPLTLRLAAEAIRREGLGAGGVLDLAARTGLFFHVRDAQIQGQLYNRILGHIHDPDVRKLAHPGLVLRLITPDIIENVLAKACGIEVDSAARAEALFLSLGREALVTTEGNALRHRADVRRVMLDLLRADQRAKVEEIHVAAVAYHAGRATLEDRAEEIYHRLCLGEDPARIDARWVAGVENHLRGAVAEVPPRQRAYLASRLGIDLDDRSRRAADLSDWERDAEKRVREQMRIGREDGLEQAITIFAERDERTDQSQLLTLEAQVLERLERWDEARRVVGAALAATSAGGDVEGRMEALRVSARIEERQGNHLECLRVLNELSTLSMTVGNEESFLRIGLDRLRVSRHAGLDGTSLRRIEGEIDAVLRRRSRQAIALEPRLYGELAVALGRPPAEVDGMKPLSTDQLRLLIAALESTFPTSTALSRMVRFALDKNLYEISSGGSLGTTVFDLVRTAEAEGWTLDLVKAAMDGDPGNPYLNKLVASLDLAARTLLRVRDEQMPSASPQYGTSLSVPLWSSPAPILALGLPPLMPDNADTAAPVRIGPAQVIEIHTAAVQIGLAQSRTAMMSGIAPGFVASLATAASPAAQLLQDLHALNSVGSLEDGTLPLKIWLQNAVTLSGPRRESAVFRRALEQITVKKNR